MYNASWQELYISGTNIRKKISNPKENLNVISSIAFCFFPKKQHFSHHIHISRQLQIYKKTNKTRKKMPGTDK